VTGDDWHTGHMDDNERKEIGARVLTARRAAGMDKEPAAREARVSSITWTRVEEGEAVRDTSLAKVLRVVGLSVEPETAVPVTVGELSDAELLEEIVRRFDRLTSAAVGATADQRKIVTSRGKPVRRGPRPESAQPPSGDPQHQVRP